MKRRQFINQSTLTAASLIISGKGKSQTNSFPVVRTAAADRKFTSKAVEDVISSLQTNIGNKEIAWMFGNCFPNTLDTTVDFEVIDGKPDTYVITGDIDAMWLRDSTAQVWPYIPLCHKDRALQQLIAGVINRQTKCILLDPYANAFYKDVHKISEWKSDLTEMKPGIHERKWEIDSLCYPIRLAFGYWKETGDITPLDDNWKAAMRLVLKTFREQQRFHGKGPYSFQRTTAWATDGVPLSGYGYPAKPNGLICSTFRPSDDSTLFPYLIPSNFFAVEALGYLQQLCMQPLVNEAKIASDAKDLQSQLKVALMTNGIIQHPQFGKIIAFEVNGYGSFHMMDDANVPSLLSLPYLGAFKANDPLYLNTRSVVLSYSNPFFYKGSVAEGIGGPHTGADTIWPMSIILRGITSNNITEIKKCLIMLQQTHGGTGFIHESIHKDDANKFTRKWFAWANTLFGEFVWKIYRENKQLLS